MALWERTASLWQSLCGWASGDSQRDDNLVVEPFAQIGGCGIYNPIMDRTEPPGTQRYQLLSQLLGGTSITKLNRAARRDLSKDGWLVHDNGQLAARSRLMHVSLETHTVCNQACNFCPVSIAPRPAAFMPTELFERIVDQLVAYRSTLRAVALNNYNEPLADRRFVSQVKLLKERDIPVLLLTNASLMDSSCIAQLTSLGGVAHLSVNLSTLRRDEYQQTRGRDHLPVVLRNLREAGQHRLADQMRIVVLGQNDERHDRNYEEICREFAGTNFEVKQFSVMDRAGYLPVGLSVPATDRQLGGCANLGSRPVQHLHINPQGQCILCCEDYDERLVVGDLTRQSVPEVLASPEFQRLRLQAYGLAESSPNFICRKCVFACWRPISAQPSCGSLVALDSKRTAA